MDSVPATPFISLIFLNYKNFGKSGWFVTVTGAVKAWSAVLGEKRGFLMEGMRWLQAGNRRIVPGFFWSRRKRVQILPLCNLCPGFIETYLEVKIYQTYSNFHQFWTTNCMFLEFKQGPCRCFFFPLNSLEKLSWGNPREEMSHWLSWVAGFTVPSNPEQEKKPWKDHINVPYVPWLSSMSYVRLSPED